MRWSILWIGLAAAAIEGLWLVDRPLGGTYHLPLTLSVLVAVRHKQWVGPRSLVAISAVSFYLLDVLASFQPGQTLIAGLSATFVLVAAPASWSTLVRMLASLVIFTVIGPDARLDIDWVQSAQLTALVALNGLWCWLMYRLVGLYEQRL